MDNSFFKKSVLLKSKLAANKHWGGETNNKLLCEDFSNHLSEGLIKDRQK